MMLDWNDLRYFLAVAEQGSTLAAGRALRVSQTTVARRIAALEEALGLPLFEKRQAGYALTPAGEELLDRARQVEAAARRLCRSRRRRWRATLSGSGPDHHPGNFRDHPARRRCSGTARPASGDRDRTRYAAGAARPWRGRSRHRAAQHRPAKQPAGVVGRRICIDDWTLYCSREYADRHGVPRTRDELQEHAIIGGGGGNLWLHYEAWLRSLGLEDQVAMHHATSTGLLSAVRSGFGIAVLPCIVADAEPDLIRCLPPRADHGRDMWLLTHERVRHTPRVRLVIDFLYERLMRHVRMLEAQRAAGLAISEAAAPFGHRPFADRDLDRRRGQQPRGIEDRQRRDILRDQQRDFGADQRHRVAALGLQASR